MGVFFFSSFSLYVRGLSAPFGFQALLHCLPPSLCADLSRTFFAPASAVVWCRRAGSRSRGRFLNALLVSDERRKTSALRWLFSLPQPHRRFWTACGIFLDANVLRTKKK